MVLDTSFDVFVCYFERTAKDYAEMVHETLTKDRDYRVYVDHLYRQYVTGEFEETIDKIIKQSRIFILINSQDALTRPQVIRETKTAFPQGKISGHDFWILHDKKYNLARTSSDFERQTGIPIAKLTQIPFYSVNEIARITLSKCDHNIKQEEANSSPPKPPQVTIPTQVRTLSYESNLSILSEQADEQLKSRDYDQSLQLYQMVLDQDPTNVAALNNIGVIFGFSGKFEEAEQYFTSAIYLNNKIPSIWENKAQALFDQNLLDKALTVIERASELSNDASSSLYLKAIILFKSRSYSDALGVYELLLKKEPESSVFLTGKAITLDKLGGRKSAYVLLEKAIEIDPHNDNAFYNLGVLLGEDKQFDMAVNVLNKSIRLNPKNPHAYVEKAIALRKLLRDEEALAAHDEAIRWAPKNPIFYFNKGTALALMLRVEDSIPLFKKALDIDPNHHLSLFNLAESYRQLENLDEALQILESLVASGKKDVRLLNVKGLIYIDKNELLKAEECFREATIMAPTDFDSFAHLAFVLYHQEKFDDAIKAYNGAVDIETNNTNTRLDRSAALIKVGKYDEAIKDCEYVIRINPAAGTSYYNMACAKLLKGERSEVIHLLTEAFKRDPNLKRVAEKDEELKSIRGEKGFIELLKSG